MHGLMLNVPGVRPAVVYLLRALGIYVLAHYGWKYGTSNTHAAANATILTNVWALAASSGGRLVVTAAPAGNWWALNAVSLNHGASSLQKAISIVGIGGSSASGAHIKVYGTNGPYISLATSSDSPLAMCSIENLYIDHGSLPTNGATLRLGYVGRFLVRNVRMMGSEAFIGVQLIASASIHMQDCTITVQDASGAACVSCEQTIDTGGLIFTACDLTGVFGSNTTGLYFQNSGDIDTVIIQGGTSLKDNYAGIRANASTTGFVQNLLAVGIVIDVCKYAVLLFPAASYGSWYFTGCWVAGSIYALAFSSENGGSISSVSYTGGLLTEPDNVVTGDTMSAAILLRGGVSNVTITGARVAAASANAAGKAAMICENVSSTHPSHVTVTGSYLRAGASADAVITATSGTTPITVVGNDLKGGADADGLAIAGVTSTGGTSRTVTANSYTA